MREGRSSAEHFSLRAFTWISGVRGDSALVFRCWDLECSTMALPQLGYKYVRALYPTDRAGMLAGRVGAELSPTSSISNSLSVYGSPFSASHTYSAFLPYSSDVSVLNHLVSYLHAS